MSWTQLCHPVIYQKVTVKIVIKHVQQYISPWTIIQVTNYVMCNISFLLAPVMLHSRYMQTSPRMGVQLSWKPRMQLAFSNSSINTPAAVITSALHYTFTHVSTVNYLFNARFFRKLLYNRKSFPMNNQNIMQPWNFSTVNDLHYMVCPQQVIHRIYMDSIVC